MEFAGKEIYLSKLKKQKINKIRKSELENKDEALGRKEEEKEDEKEIEDKKEEKKENEEDMELQEDDNLEEEISRKIKKYGDKKNKKRKFSDGSNNSDLSDDEKLSVCSGDFDKDLKDSDNLSIDEEAAPMHKPNKKGQIFKKEIDTNICLIRYNELQKESENIILHSYQCKKCQSYLNKFSNLVQSGENGKYEWKCEFCSEINKDLGINQTE